MDSALWVVMPVYNEEECLGPVVEEWLPVLRQEVGRFTLCILDDGSKDRTPAILDALAAKHPEIRAIHKPNSGHGQTCLTAYRLARDAGAQWVFQIDSDGQCDPAFFREVWRARQEAKVVYGYRRRRDDGLLRLLISRVVSVVTFLSTGIWVADANVPYRLAHRDALDVADEIAPDFHLANVMVAALHQERFGIRWVDIRFRCRRGGTPAVKTYSFAKQGWRLFRNLRARQRAPHARVLPGGPRA